MSDLNLTSSDRGKPDEIQRVVFSVQAMIDRYRADRRALFGLFDQIPKGWKFQIKRDPEEGDPSIPPRVFRHRTTGPIKIGGKTFRGVATIDMPETYAPPQAVELIGPDGNRPTPKTPQDDLEYKLLILLRQMLDNVKQLTLGLLWLEREPAKRGMTTDTSPISRLYQALPAFPYRPFDQKLEADKILSEEQPLLDDALLTLRRMAIEDERNRTMKAENDTSPPSTPQQVNGGGPATKGEAMPDFPFSFDLWRKNMESLGRQFEVAAGGPGLFHWIIQAQGLCNDVKSALDGPDLMAHWQEGGRVRHTSVLLPSNRPEDENKLQWGMASRLCGEGDAGRFMAIAEAAMHARCELPVELRLPGHEDALKVDGGFLRNAGGWLQLLHSMAWQKLPGSILVAERWEWDGCGGYLHSTVGQCANWPEYTRGRTKINGINEAFYSILGRRTAPLNVCAASASAILLVIAHAEWKLKAADAPGNGSGDRGKASGVTPTDAMLNHRQLAERYGLETEATRGILKRWRKHNHNGWIEDPDPRPNYPQFIYVHSAVHHLLNRAKQRADVKAISRTKTSGQRPAKKLSLP